MMLDNKAYEYRVGGSLPEHAPSYVTRQADRSFYYGLKSGDFCYVFNSRQMGKTSLLVRTLHRLRSEGVACTTIDVSGRGSGDIQPEQWYAGIVYTLIKDFQLANPLQFIKSWWQERDFLDPAQRLAEVIETILLPNTTEQIVIFIDEIDSILSLNFSTDDFFALIRSCYDKRSNNPDYQRLTFALIGVAKPSDLIEDKRRTPFNIGQAIELTGFTLAEAAPLSTGLKSFVDNPSAVLAQILQWTGGQPFLTQKLCFLLVQSGVSVPIGSEKVIVERLVETAVIDDWESKDNPPHFKTISTRLISNEKRSGSLLGLYQQILTQYGVKMADRPEERELQLAGIVVNYGDELRGANKIYGKIFDRSWVDKQLADLRPYASAVKEWLESGKKDESRLLRGKALEDALDWSIGKNLSNIDSQFLSVCREQRIHEANQEVLQRRIKQLWILSIIASLLAGSALFFGLQARNENEKSQIAEIKTKNALNQALIKSDDSKNSLDTLIGTLEATKLFQEQKQFLNETDREKLHQATKANLQYAVYGTLEKNRLQHGNTINGIQYSPNGQLIASVGQDKKLNIWNVNGQLIKEILHSDVLQDLAISTDSQKIFTVGDSPEVAIWDMKGEKVLLAFEQRPSRKNPAFSPTSPLATPKLIKDKFNRVAITPDSKYIAAATNNDAENADIIIWEVKSGKIIKTLKFPQSRYSVTKSIFSFHDLKFSPDGQFLVGASTDNTIKAWKWNENSQPKILTGHQDWVYCLSFTQDGKWLASSGGGGDKNVMIWGIEKDVFKLKKTIRNVHDGGFYLSFNPQKRQLITARNTLKIFDFDRILSHPNDVITANDYGDILLANISTVRPSGFRAISYSPDGNRISVGASDGQITIWEPSQALKKTVNVSDLTLLKVIHSHNGQYIATSGADKLIKIWRPDGTLVRTLAGHDGWIWGLSFSGDDQFISSASEDSTVKIWKVSDGSVVRTLKHDNQAFGVSFSPNSDYLASAGKDEKIKIWQTSNGKLLHEFQAANNEDWIWKVEFSSNGKYLANNTNKGLEIRKVSDLTKSIILDDNDVGNTKEPYTLNNISFSPDSKMIVASSVKGGIRLWNIETKKLLLKKEAHSDGISDIKFIPNSQEIVTNGEGSTSTVKIWNLNGVLQRTIEGSLSSNMSFSPDGKNLVIVNSNGVMKSWDILELLKYRYDTLEEFQQEGCKQLYEYLSTLEKESSIKSICPH
jgi:WD40 repeat protein